MCDCPAGRWEGGEREGRGAKETRSKVGQRAGPRVWGVVDRKNKQPPGPRARWDLSDGKAGKRGAAALMVGPTRQLQPSWERNPGPPHPAHPSSLP